MTTYAELDESAVEASEVTPARRVQARAMCASTRAEYRWLLVDVCARRRAGARPMEKISTSRDAARVCREFVNQSALVQELFGVLCLDTKNRPVGFAIPHAGGLDASIVDVKTVFKPALLIPAASVVLCHNHPSGDPRPSADDVALTRRLLVASEYLGVRLLDHVILGEDDQYFSFIDAGLLGGVTA
ncbi:JAB domain-containing protein [Sandaracinus amylolyticus]|uniref:DNA repair protein RadC n=1 Tax=Sandaracinus amylolyticus TaxID=927083 RepID=A0A0F6VZF6_9BACT|nr:JAB domain-containing protein [Sandaracinus amylolyticus]AKF03402.1 DNA repair protein RadC [Sandaracinus amylolyticus]